ncbi:MAG TPA: hypothetical protein VFA56_00710 [Gaiellaceae bacterium]|nr:hypothetical protein [Gaiellaceae bacterium]
MRLHLIDPAYTDRLVAYLRDLGQHPTVETPACVVVEAEPAEIEVYLSVWKVLHPDAEIQIG